MDIVRLAIQKPVGVTVGVLLLVMFGLIGLTQIPIQLTPTVDRPIITVETEWPGRSPEEVVEEITKLQEEELKNVSNLKRMKSVSSQGTANIELEFYIGADIARALQEVSDALRQVPEYPDEVEEPEIQAADGASENAIAWIIIDMPDERYRENPDFDIATIFDAVEDRIKPDLERIEGVAEVNVFGGREREVRVYADPTALAQRGLNHLDVVDALRSENTNVSAGTISEGKRDYRVRLIGQYETPEQVLETVVAYRDGNPVYVKDVATVELGHEKRRGFVRVFGHPAIAMNVIRQTDANVVNVMEQVRARLDAIQAGVLPGLAPDGYRHLADDLRIEQVYDETVYIDSAIGLVTQNLFIGGAIAGVVLMVFLRSLVSTSIIAVAIPVSIIGTFLVMLGMGRTLNVISLAGLAFAVGMVVDNAIVVLENIYRRLQAGDPPLQAAYRGGREVWGAILASSLTTAAVFVPVLTIQEEAGQLFRDIALAIVAAVLLSLLVSVTVIPAATSRWLRDKRTHRTKLGRWFSHLFGLDAVFGRLVRGVSGGIYWLMTGWRAWSLRPLVIVVMTGASVVGAIALAPPLDYLPAGNRNLVFGGLQVPPGLSVERMESIARRIETQIDPYRRATADPETYEDLPPIPRFMPGAEEQPPPFDPVPVDRYFIGSFGGGMFVGAASDLEQVVIPVGQLLTNAMNDISGDYFGGARQSSLFGRGVGGGNTVNLEVSGTNLERVREAARFMYELGGETFGFGRGVTADPGNFNLDQQEFRVTLTDRARELGIRNRDVGTVVRALFDGAFAGDYKLEGDNVDLTVLPKGGRLEYKEQLAEVPVYTPAGRIAPLDTFVELKPATAPQNIQRIEELPSVTLLFEPPEDVTVDEMMGRIRREIITPAREAGLIDPDMVLNLEGTAAKLDEVRMALFGAAGGNLSGPESGGGDPGSAATSGAKNAARAGLHGLAAVLGLGGLGVAIYALVRAVRRRSGVHAYGAVGALAIALAAGVPLFALGVQPELALARMVWALAVTYLLMCALFESFIYPFVIMFTVPLAIVGGFAGLAIIHWWSLQDPTKAPQQLDVLTMLGFVILIGVVVNNAILLVHQSLNFMRGAGESEDDPTDAMAPLEAIRESVRTRIRPIFMSVMTSVGGMLPLILFPGAGSEMYRGLGSVVVGGLVVSTIFTLVLVPLLFSLTLQAMEGLKVTLTAMPGAETRGRPSPAERAVPAIAHTRERESETEAALQTA